MYAVIKAGGHQYKVSEGDVVTIDLQVGNGGDKLKFSDVLMIGGTSAPKVGMPLLANSSVEAVIKQQKRNPKILVFKYKRRKNHKKLSGHKQPVTVVEIQKIHA